MLSAEAQSKKPCLDFNVQGRMGRVCPGDQVIAAPANAKSGTYRVERVERGQALTGIYIDVPGTGTVFVPNGQMDVVGRPKFSDYDPELKNGATLLLQDKNKHSECANLPLAARIVQTGANGRALVSVGDQVQMISLDANPYQYRYSVKTIQGIRKGMATLNFWNKDPTFEWDDSKVVELEDAQRGVVDLVFNDGDIRELNDESSLQGDLQKTEAWLKANETSARSEQVRVRRDFLNTKFRKEGRYVAYYDFYTGYPKHACTSAKSRAYVQVPKKDNLAPGRIIDTSSTQGMVVKNVYWNRNTSSPSYIIEALDPKTQKIYAVGTAAITNVKEPPAPAVSRGKKRGS